MFLILLLFYTVGGLNLDQEPLICGGVIKGLSDPIKECYTYRDNTWVATTELNVARYGSAITRTPSKELFISGGKVHLKPSINLPIFLFMYISVLT